MVGPDKGAGRGECAHALEEARDFRLGEIGQQALSDPDGGEGRVEAWGVGDGGDSVHAESVGWSVRIDRDPVERHTNAQGVSMQLLDHTRHPYYIPRSSSMASQRSATTSAWSMWCSAHIGRTPEAESRSSL